MKSLQSTLLFTKGLYRGNILITNSDSTSIMTVSDGSKAFYQVAGLRIGELPNVARGMATLHQTQAIIVVDCGNLMFGVG